MVVVLYGEYIGIFELLEDGDLYPIDFIDEDDFEEWKTKLPENTLWEPLFLHYHPEYNNILFIQLKQGGVIIVSFE